MAVEVEKHAGSGTLKISWGTTVWTAQFKLGEQTIAKAQRD